ncbi:MAG: hypothetical protein MJ189_02515 [Coriobacteriales bacterium]|nr:hypothetical protein [Coriobacteriales bacterium]
MDLLYSTKSYAKVNLSLNVKWPPFSSGYHELSSVFQKVELHDKIEFYSLTAPESQAQSIYNTKKTYAGTSITIEIFYGYPVKLEGPLPYISIENNLIFKAIENFEEENRIALPIKHLFIKLTKHIPTGAGLGGGSSNAASTLKFCENLLLNHSKKENNFTNNFINKSIEEITESQLQIASKIGADVSFFYIADCAYMKGNGDKLVKHLPKLPFPIILLGGNEEISTAKIYQKFDENPQAFTAECSLAKLFEDYDNKKIDRYELAGALPRVMNNNFENIVCEMYPRIKYRIDTANNTPGIICALLTGTGSTSFAVCADELTANGFADYAKGFCNWVFVSLPKKNS